MAPNKALTKLISLSYTLAVGFVFVVLAGALYGNWYPMVSAFLFAVAHIPRLVTSNYSRDDFTSETSVYLEDFGKFLSGFLLVSGVGFPLVLWHSEILDPIACVFTLAGGSIIFRSVYEFLTYFDAEEETFEL